MIFMNRLFLICRVHEKINRFLQSSAVRECVFHVHYRTASLHPIISQFQDFREILAV